MGGCWCIRGWRGGGVILGRGVRGGRSRGGFGRLLTQARERGTQRVGKMGKRYNGEEHSFGVGYIDRGVRGIDMFKRDTNWREIAVRIYTSTTKSFILLMLVYDF